MNYQWQKSLWTRPLRILHDGHEVGRLVYDNTFTSRATGETEGRVFRFRTKGLLKPTITITDEDGRTYEVELGTWRSRGRMVGGLEWSTNVWNNSWRWTSESGDPIISSATDNLQGTRGTITIKSDAAPVDSRVLLLVGLYVNAYFTEAAIVLIVILAVWWA